MQTHAAAINHSVQKRNPVIQLVMGWGACAGGSVLGSIVAGITGVAILATVLSLVGAVVAGHFLKSMVEEAKKVSNDDSINPVLFYIPGVNQILSFLKVHGAVERARYARGVQTPAKPKWMYLIIPWYAIAADLNDLAR